MKKIWALITLSLIAAISVPVTAAEPKSEKQYAAILLEGKKIGRVVHTRTEADGLVRTTDETSMTVSRAGISITVTIAESYVETPDGQPKGFEVIQNISGMNQSTTGTVDEKGIIHVRTESLGGVQERQMPWPEGALMAEGMRLLELEKKLTKGTRYTASMFSPSMMTTIEATVTVGEKAAVDLLGRVATLTKMTTVMKTPAGAMTSVTYVDDECNALKTITPMMGMTLEIIACDKEFAMSENSDVIDFLDKMLLPSPISLTRVKPNQTVVYSISPKAGADLRIPSDDSQSVQSGRNGGLQITVHPASPPQEAKFPYDGEDPAALECLKPTQYLECNVKEIQDMAKAAVGSTTDAATAAHQIESFVRGFITSKDLSVGYATAAEVASSRQGDCTEHAVLTAAMCRAVGIPARVAFGLVHVEEFAGRRNVFGGHAWAEAYVGGKWIGLDATRAPNGYSPLHIKLATGNGDPKDFFGMVTTLGYFTIDKIEVK